MWYEQIWKMILCNKTLGWMKSGVDVSFCWGTSAADGRHLFSFSPLPACWQWSRYAPSGQTPNPRDSRAVIGDTWSSQRHPHSHFTKRERMYRHQWSSSRQQPGARWKSYLCSGTITTIMVGPRWWCASHQSSWHYWENSIYPETYHWWPPGLSPWKQKCYPLKTIPNSLYHKGDHTSKSTCAVE